MKRLAIVGASGHGKVVADVAMSRGYSDILFFDDQWPKIKMVGSFSIVGNVQSLEKLWAEFDHTIVAIGKAEIRENIQSKLENIAPAMIHSSAIVGSDVSIGCGTVVMPGAIINSGTQIGKGCIINSGAVIEHDCVVGDFVHVAPKAALAGGVSVGESSWIGIGASIIQQIKIEKQVVIGAGSVVIEDVAEKTVVVGVPAKPLIK